MTFNFDDLFKQFESKINGLLEVIENCETNIKKNCDYLKAEIEISVDSVMDQILKLRENLFIKIDLYEQECLKKLKERENEKQRIKSSIEALKENLDQVDSENIESLENSFKKEELRANLYLRSYFKLNYRDSDDLISLPNDLIGEIFYTDSNFNEVKYIIDIERLKKLTTYHETNCIINFDLEGDMEIHSRKIVSLPNRQLLISITTIDSIEYMQMDTQIKILTEDGVLLNEKFILDFGLLDCHLLSDDLLVCLLEDKVNYAYSISTYSLDITLIDTEILTFEVQSISIYNNDIYVLSADSPLITVFDRQLRIKCSFGHVIDSNDVDFMIDSYSIFVHNEFLYSKCITSPQIDTYDLKTLKKLNVTQLNIDQFGGDVIRYIDAFERIIVYNDTTKIIKIFDKDGKLLYEREINSKGIFCITQSGRIVFYDKLCTLHIY